MTETNIRAIALGYGGFAAAPGALPAARKGFGMKRCRRMFSVLCATSVAGAMSVLSAAGCGAPRNLAPEHLPLRAACAHPAAPLSAAQLERAYKAPAMSAAAETGAGTTIAVVIPAAATHVSADIAEYSRASRLPTPQLKIVTYGDVPIPSGGYSAGWEQEGTIDLEMAHALAPQAKLIYLAVPDRDGPTGIGLMYDAALSWLVARYQPTVVNYSVGIPEDWDGQLGYRLIAASRAGLEAAARAGTTVVASAGDYGPAEPVDGMLQRTVAWPASDPLVTAVGGTRLTADRHGAYSSAIFAYAHTPEGGGAGGAGLSAVFSRPSWQDKASAITGSRRGVADVSMDASPCSPVAIYNSINGLPGRHPGWTYVSGTSVAAPLFAGITADAAQAAGHPLGVLGPALYRMHGAADGVADVTVGTDAMPGLPGYPAHPGYDLPTGIGTVASAVRFIAALARLAASRP